MRAWIDHLWLRVRQSWVVLRWVFLVLGAGLLTLLPAWLRRRPSTPPRPSRTAGQIAAEAEARARVDAEKRTARERAAEQEKEDAQRRHREAADQAEAQARARLEKLVQDPDELTRVLAGKSKPGDS